MDFRVTCDANAESRVDQIMFGINDAFEKYFGDRFYDDSGVAMFVILTCRDPAYNFKQRIRFSKKENCLYMDLMFDLNNMIHANMAEGKRIVGEKIVTEIPQIVAKYKFKDFDLARFSSDLKDWFETHGWIDKPEIL